MGLKFYRFYSIKSVSGDEDHPYYRYNVKCEEWDLLKETPSGYWIEYKSSMIYGKKWVRKVGKNLYAHSTKQAALNSFIKRKQRCISIYESRIETQRCFLQEVSTKSFASLHGINILESLIPTIRMNTAPPSILL